MEIPVFPLNAVLFPGMILPLHIFEERYKVMINQCLQERRPFGVVLIREGREVGALATPHDVGTMAAIKSANRLEKDELEIMVVGLSRFRIDRMVTTWTYPRAEVTDFPLQEGNRARARILARQVRALFLTYVKSLEEATNLQLKMNEVPDEPETIAALVAIAMQIELRDKQHIIERETVEDMLWAESGFLAREQVVLEHMIETREQPDRLRFGPTGQMFPN